VGKRGTSGNECAAKGIVELFRRRAKEFRPEDDRHLSSGCGVSIRRLDFLIADDHFFLGIVVFLAASWMLSISDSNINDGEKETNKEPAVSAIRKRKRYRVAVNVGRTH
jgi:hypothetical protein